MPEKIKLTFLGTSDAVPSARRNHTAVLLTYKEENILVDCGEGTQRQIRKAKLNPCKITRILITHKHGDHSLGLVGLLQTMSLSGYNKTLFIYGPKGIAKFLRELFHSFGFRSKFQIVIKEVDGRFAESDDFYLFSKKMKHSAPCNGYSFILKDKNRIDKKKLQKFNIKPGKHLQKIKDGKSVKIEGKTYSAKDLLYIEKGKKITFVYDTVDNPNIVKLAEDSDVFICEASFSSDLKDKAKEHEHMTSDQTAKAAKKAKVKKLILTHVSQRHENHLEDVLKEAKKFFKESHLVKDLDVIEV